MFYSSADYINKSLKTLSGYQTYLKVHCMIQNGKDIKVKGGVEMENRLDILDMQLKQERNITALPLNKISIQMVFKVFMILP